MNRFRGDPALFRDGVDFPGGKTHSAMSGGVPVCARYRSRRRRRCFAGRCAERDGTVAIVRFPRISNFTDFDRIAGATWIDDARSHVGTTLSFCPGRRTRPAICNGCGTRGSIAGYSGSTRRAKVIGVCGGYQMLGRSVDGQPGLGLLPVDTTMQPEKTVRPVRAR